MKIGNRRVFVLLLVLTLFAGCARISNTGKTLLKPKSFGELQTYLLRNTANLDQFRMRGPFEVVEQEDIEIRLSPKELVRSDLFLSAHAEKAPLVVFLHGYDSKKENHSFQAAHVASWGMHALVLQLPGKGPWLANGRLLTRVIRFIQRWPDSVDNRIDVNKIILVGHSFGGAAVTIAMAEGAPAVGGILLDPAVLGIDLPRFLRQITTPVMLLGADEHVAMARNRDYFYRFVRTGIAEVSIKDASHEDAQYPADSGAVTEELQVSFVSAITSAAFSFATNGNLEYAWSSFADDFKNGNFFNAKRK